MAEMIVGHNALKGIREAVQADIDLGELIYIMDESENELTVVDNTEDTDRAIRYVSHDKITPTWLEGKIVITYSAGWYDQAVDPHSLAEYLFKTVDKHVLQTLEHIVIVSADTERDWDELFSILEDRHGNPILEVCDLPDECVGIQWTEYQTVVVNLGNIIGGSALAYLVTPMGWAMGSWVLCLPLVAIAVILILVTTRKAFK